MSTISQLNNQTSFQSVIGATQQLLDQIGTQSLQPDAITADVIHLLNLDKGPRGFFASLLTDSRSLADDPPASILAGLKAVPEVTAKLLTQNLAMSTAMIVFHTRQQDAKNRAGSQQVQTRSQTLIKQLNLAAVYEELAALKQSTSQPGPYSEFLDRWNYDAQQKQAIADVVTVTLANQ